MNTTELIKLLQKLNIKYSFREDTPENWKIANPILSSGEPAVEIGTGLFKIGDGKTPWNSLKYANSHENSVSDVQPNGKYYVRTKQSPTTSGTWVELTDFNNILRDAPKNEKSYLRMDGEWVELKVDDIATKFESPWYVPTISDNVWTSSIKIVAKNVAEKSTAKFIATNSMMELPFELEFLTNGNIQLVESSSNNYVLYRDGVYADNKGTIGGIPFEFECKTQILKFSKQVLLNTVQVSIKDNVLVLGKKKLDLQDVYDIIPKSQPLTLFDLYRAANNTELYMQDYYHDVALDKPIFGMKIYKENISTNEVILTGIERLLSVAGNIKIDDKIVYVPGQSVEIQLDNGNVIVKTSDDVETLNNSSLELVLLYTKL